jgi:lysyl-tRNA synthetase class 1
MEPMNTPEYQIDWLEELAKQISLTHPKGEIVISSGHSPSGTYHIGTLREIMTANAIAFELRRQGREAKHIDFVDDFDALRKVPVNIPETWSQYIGQPLALVPDPSDCHQSYGAHYLAGLHAGLEAVGAMPDETISGYEVYKTGVLADQIELALNGIEDVKKIITTVGGRALDEHWAPLQILSDEQNLRQWKYTGWDAKTRQVSYVDREGNTGTVGIDDGRVKLDWRLDWPARWAKWGVMVEPFGRDHATKGGSYDTGKVLVDTIFDGAAPYPVPYEFINNVGDTKKMSKSAGNVLTPNQALEVMPAEILRYFVIGSKPGKTLQFDSGIGLYQLIDNYTKAGLAESAALNYAHAVRDEETIAQIPFNHLVSVYQAASENAEATKEILERTGYMAEVKSSWPIIVRELTFVAKWLENYAPESVVFKIQKSVPKVELTEEQTYFLNLLADSIEATKGDIDGQAMHELIYAAKDKAELKPMTAFQALYRVILGKDSGPKAGWFLSSLEINFLIPRLRLEK